MSGGVGLGGLGYCRALGQGARAWHRVWSDAAHGGSQHKVCRGSGRSLRKCERDCVMHRTRNCASLGCTSRPLRRAVMHTHIHAWAEAYPGELQTRICTARECCLPGGRWAHEAATQRVAALPEELTSMRGRAATIRRYILPARPCCCSSGRRRNNNARVASCFYPLHFLPAPLFSSAVAAGSGITRVHHCPAEPFQTGCDGAPEGRTRGPTVNAASKMCGSKGEAKPILLCLVVPGWQWGHSLDGTVPGPLSL